MSTSKQTATIPTPKGMQTVADEWTGDGPATAPAERATTHATHITTNSKPSPDAVVQLLDPS